MKRFIITALTVSAILTGCRYVNQAPTTTTEVVTQTTTADVKRASSDNDIIKNATSKVTPNTWFRSGNYTYYMKENGQLAKNTQVTSDKTIATRKFVDDHGRLLTIDDFKELENYYIELMKNHQVFIPNSAFLSLGLNAKNVSDLCANYINETVGSWIDASYDITPDGLKFYASDTDNSVNDYSEYIKAMNKLNSLNLNSLDDIINYGFDNISIDKTDAKETNKATYPNLYGALVENKTNCDGFTHFIYWACRKNNIPVRLVGISLKYPDGHVINHALNQIYINGEWKYFDLMWESEARTFRDQPMFFTDIANYYSHDFINEDTGIRLVPNKAGSLIEYID